MARGSVQARALRQSRREPLVHVCPDVPAFEQEVLESARHIRQVHQRHARFLGRAVGLAAVAHTAGGDQVHPGPAAAARLRHDVFALQVALVEALRAVGAGQPVYM